MRVSIIIPCFNCQKIIKDSILKLQKKLKKLKKVKYELIFIDDGSSDNTVKVINNFISKNITLIKNHKNLSIACATSGGVLGFLAFACPVCNKLIVLVLGFSGAMTYFAPIQPMLGILGVLLLLYGNFTLIRRIQNGNNKK